MTNSNERAMTTAGLCRADVLGKTLRWLVYRHTRAYQRFSAGATLSLFNIEGVRWSRAGGRPLFTEARR